MHTLIAPRIFRDCKFCDTVVSEDRRVAEFGSMFAVYDRYPVTEGHLLIIPYRHVEYFFDLTSDEVHDTIALIKALHYSLASKDSTITGFNIGMNCGVSAGQTVMHAHIHLIPRRDGDLENPRGGVRGVIPHKMDYGEGEPNV